MIRGYVEKGNVMIAGYLHGRHPGHGLKLFNEMEKWGAPGPTTTMGFGNYIVHDYEMCGDVVVGNTYSPVQDVLAAIVILGALESDKWVHFYITRNKFELTVNLGTTFMNLYAKCEFLDNSLVNMGYAEI
ncbi:pentatricopeptide repeat-containing protein At3g62890-like [Aristolochia californica]|uniref:pentatricopeptide repeat-containing protein At3g62890-like n=1 Tax=Aristolochia californica TaxID=171875 RepID=UPI0035DEA5A9